MPKNKLCLALILGFAFLGYGPVFAQSPSGLHPVQPTIAQFSAPVAPNLTPLPLKGPLSDIHSAPTPVDANGNPIKPKPPTQAEIDNERRLRIQREDKAREAKEREITDARHAAEDSSAKEHLAEEKRFHDRIMTALYVGLVIVAIGIGSKIFKRR